MLHMASSSQILGGEQGVSEPLSHGSTASRKVHLRKSRNRGKTNVTRRRRRSMTPEKVFPVASEASVLGQGKSMKKKVVLEMSR